MKRAQSLTRRVMKAKRAQVTPEERNARRVVRERSQGQCEVCGHARGESMHHRRKAGREWTPANLLHTCGDGVRGCHGRIEASPNAAKEQGWWLLSNQDPARTPVWLAGRGYVFLADDGSIHDTDEEAA
jgi:hypothetical protein